MNSLTAAISLPFPAALMRSSEGESLKVGRQGDANRLKELTSDAGGRGAQQEALAILLKLDFLQPVEIAQDVVTFGCDVVPGAAILEFLAEQQSKEGAELVAANGLVAAVVDWTSGKHGLGLTEQLLDPQSVAIAQHDLKRGELGVGAQHIEPVKARVFGDPRLVDGEVLGRDGLEIAAETAVADERLVAPRLREGRLWASLARSPSRMALRCSASRRASARLRQTMYRRLPILTCLASSSVSSPETRGTTSGTKGV